MSKFCGNCGTELQDDAVVCSNCGVNIAPQQPEAAASAPASDATPGEVAVAAIKDKSLVFINKMKSDKKFMGIVLGSIAGVILVIVLLCVLMGGGYKSAIENYFDAMQGDYDAYVACMPEDVFDDYLDYKDMSKKELKEEMEDSSDGDLKVSYDILDTDELDEDDLDDIKDYLKENLDISKKDVTEAIEVELEVTLKYDGEKMSNETDVVVVKIDGDWYVYEVLESIASEMKYSY